MRLFCLLFILGAISVYGQKKDSVMCLTKTEVLTLANKIQLLQDSSRYKTSIINAQNKLILVADERIDLYQTQLGNRDETIVLMEKTNMELKKQIELLKPKWYDDNRLWFTGGVLLTTILFVTAR